MTRGAPEPTDDPRTWPVRRTESYGGVVVRGGPEDYEVALIRPRPDERPGGPRRTKEVWALPKGAKDDDEDARAAALREVREETGIAAEVIDELEPITYWFTWPAERVRYRKTVRFFLMRADASDPVPDGFEVAEVRYVPLPVAHKVATYPSERKVLEAAAERIHSAW